MKTLLNIVMKAALEAGNEILEIYRTDFQVEFKKDASPLTLADKNAHEIISSWLYKTDFPVLSEEGKSLPYNERKEWNELWIVDPLDGTKEFIKKNGEFTVNIALVKNGEPVLGVVFAPVLDTIYYGAKDFGAFKLENVSLYENINELFQKASPLPLVLDDKNYFGIVASRSHLSPETVAYIDEVSKGKENVKIVSKGSSLKLCMVAEGAADVYPRFAPTSEWDTAAGDAIVRASGAQTLNAITQKPLAYNKKDILNPWFVVKRE